MARDIPESVGDHRAAMSRDHRLADFHPFAHIHLQEPQPPLVPAHHYPYPFQHLHHLSNPSATPAYEMTSACAGADADDDAVHSLHSLDPRKRNSSHFDAGDYEMGDAGAAPAAACTPRKRRTSSFGSASAFGDCCDDSRSQSSRATSRTNSYATSCATMPDRKQNHSEIEKRRRDKMNMYISELSGMIPMCGVISRKLDKLTVMRMAVQHLRSVCGAQSASPLAARPRPACVSERDLNALLLRAAAAGDAFLVVVGCDRGRLHYVSRSVTNVLRYDQSELLGQSLFDILHPKDVAKVKEQLSSSDLSPRDRLIDAKTMLPVKAEVVAGAGAGAQAQRLCPGARRSFFCRIKCKHADPAAKNRKKNDKKYCVVQCTGYLKSWTEAEAEAEAEAKARSERVPVCDDEQSGLSCLVAVGRALPEAEDDPPPPAHTQQAPPTRRLQYISRHAIDGKFLFVDQRVRLALGFLPQELLGTSLYEHVSGPELGAVARAHKLALLRKEPLRTPPYAFTRKDGSRAHIQTHFKPFRNPWTKEVECLVANNTIVSQSEHALPDMDDAKLSYENFAQSEVDAEVQRLIEAQVESHRIGAAIAEVACRRPPPAPAHPHPQDPVFNTSLADNILSVGRNALSSVRNNVALSAAAGAPSPSSAPSPAPYGGAEAGAAPSPPLGLDGNGEAAMAVIMNLLEADAGLGGPVNFSGLPWPLP